MAKGKLVRTRTPEREHFAKKVSKPRTGQKANRARARAARKPKGGYR